MFVLDGAAVVPGAAVVAGAAVVVTAEPVAAASDQIHNCKRDFLNASVVKIITAIQKCFLHNLTVPIPHVVFPRLILMYPWSPQLVPHEFLIIQ